MFGLKGLIWARTMRPAVQEDTPSEAPRSNNVQAEKTVEWQSDQAISGKLKVGDKVPETGSKRMSKGEILT